MASNAPLSPQEKSRRRRTLLLAAAAALGLLAIGGAATTWRLGMRLVAPAHGTIGDPPTDIICETVTLASKSGAQIAGWYLPANDTRGVIVLTHSIRGSRLNLVRRARLFHDAGYAVLLIDLQAHGESTGEQITMGHLEQHDVRAAVDFAKSRHPQLPIAVDGSSLGGAAAILASPLGIDALIVESVYPTIEEAVQNRTRMRLGPLGPLAAAILIAQLQPRLGIPPAELRPIDHIAKVDCPLLILAGSEDRHTTAEESQRLYQAAREPREIVTFEGAAHTDLEGYDPVKFREVTLRFLDEHMQSDAKAVQRAEAPAATTGESAN